MSVAVYDARDEVKAYSDCARWSYSSTAGLRTEGLADTLAQIYSEILGRWREKSFIVTSENTLKNFLASELAAIPEVRRVSITEREKGGNRIVVVWTALAAYDREVRYRVYEIEEKILDKFPDQLFDFHVFMERDGLPSGEVPVYGKRK